MGDPNDRLIEMSGQIGQMRAEILAMKSTLERLEKSVAVQQELSDHLRFGGRVAVILMGLFGGAIGGKIAHLLGLFGDKAASH